MKSDSGGVYTSVLQSEHLRRKHIIHTQLEDVSPNNVNVFLQVPQYVIMTAGECFFSVTGLAFAYSQVLET